MGILRCENSAIWIFSCRRETTIQRSICSLAKVSGERSNMSGRWSLSMAVEESLWICTSESYREDVPADLSFDYLSKRLEP